MAVAMQLTNETTSPQSTSLLSRLIRRGIWMQTMLAVLLFVPAGTLNYWQGWGFWLVSFLLPLFLTILFYKRDPQLIERRLLRKETFKEQKFFAYLAKAAAVPAY